MSKKRKHRKTKNPIQKIEKNDSTYACIICLDNTDEPCILSQTICLPASIDYYYWKQDCECNILIHTSCMTAWMSYHRACPICLHDMKKTPSIYLYVNRIRGIAYYILFMYVIYHAIDALNVFLLSRSDCLSI